MKFRRILFNLYVSILTDPDGEAALTTEDSDSYGWLEEIEMPENSQMDGIEYLGPQVTEPKC